MLKKIIFSLLFLFTTHIMAANWSSPFNVSPPSGAGTGSFAPRVAVDNAGNAVAVWYFLDASNNFVIQAATLPFGATSWISRNSGLPASSPTQNLFEPDVAVDCDGNAVLIYALDTSLGNGLGAAILPFGATAWTPANTGLLALSFNNFVQNPRVAVDCNGNAVAVWSNDPPGPRVIQAATLSAGSTTWTLASSNLSQAFVPGATAFEFPHVAVDGNGNAVAVWDMSDGSGTGTVVQAATLSFGSNTWISRNAGLPAYVVGQFPSNSQLAVDKAGNAVVVFAFNQGSNDGMAAATLLFGATAWVPANAGLPAPSINYFIFVPQVAVDCEGNAVAIWDFFSTTFPNGVVQAAYLPFGTTTWIPASANLSSPSTNDQPVTTALSSNIFGDFIGVWELFNSANDTSVIQAAVLPSGKTTTWDATQTISGTFPSSFTFFPLPDVSIGYNGKAVSVWSLTNPTNNVQSATIQLPVSAFGSVQEFSGRVVTNKFLTQTEYAHQLCWKAINSKCFTVACYRIYCGDQLVTAVGGNATQVCLHNRTCNLPCYRLVAFDAEGNALASAIVNQ